MARGMGGGARRHAEEARGPWGGVSGRAVAWLAYVPVPGLAAVAVLAAPRDRLARYHAWQGGLLVGAAYVWLAAWGFAAAAAGDAVRGVVSVMAGLGLAAFAAGALWGLGGAARGRYVRVRPVWDALRALGR